MPKGETPEPSTQSEDPKDGAVEKSVPEKPDRFYEFVGKAVIYGGAVAGIVVALTRGLSTPPPDKPATPPAHPAPAPLVRAHKPPRQLPARVQEDYDGVIQITYGEHQASGVKVDSHQALTAGHLVMFNGEGHPNPVICGQQASTLNVHSTTPFANQITNYFGHYDGPNSSGFPDYALVNIDADNSFRSLPRIPIAQATPTVGSIAYFINYEINNAGTVYSYPNQTVADDFEGNTVDRAAEYAGVVIAESASTIVVATGLQGYGPAQGRQVNTHHGGSGGAVLDRAGELEGLSEEGDSQSVGSIAAQYGVLLPLSSTHDVGVTYVQPITRAILHNAQAQMPSQPDC